MNDAKLIEIKELIDKVIYSSTKKEAQPLIKRLEFIASTARGDLNGYTVGKLSEAINYAEAASGRVNDKEHWRSCMETSFYVFENDVKAHNRAARKNT